MDGGGSGGGRGAGGEWKCGLFNSVGWWKTMNLFSLHSNGELKVYSPLSIFSLLSSSPPDPPFYAKDVFSK